MTQTNRTPLVTCDNCGVTGEMQPNFGQELLRPKGWGAAYVTFGIHHDVAMPDLCSTCLNHVSVAVKKALGECLP